MKSIKKGSLITIIRSFVKNVVRGQTIINSIIQQGSANKLPFFSAAYENFFSALSQKLTPSIFFSFSLSKKFLVDYQTKFDIIQTRKSQVTL